MTNPFLQYLDDPAPDDGAENPFAQYVKQTASASQSPLAAYPDYDGPDWAGTAARSFLRGVPGGDELAAGLGSLFTGKPYTQIRDEEKAIDEMGREEYPVTSTGFEVGGALAPALMTMGMGAPAAAGSVARTLPQMALHGAKIGAGTGFVYGFGAGEDGFTNRLQSGAEGAGIGAVTGGAFPYVQRGVQAGWSRLRNPASKADDLLAKTFGLDKRTTGALREAAKQDDAIPGAAMQRLTTAGDEAMLADAGPTTASMLDTVVQRGGSGAAIAKRAMNDRVKQSWGRLTAAMDDAFGKLDDAAMARTAKPETGALYEKAYATPIDYTSQAGYKIEDLLKRVPADVIKGANRLMVMEGQKSKQILAKIADDGSVTFESLPDVRQIDYITRALNDTAYGTVGAGARGGMTNAGRVTKGLAKDLRDTLRTHVGSYDEALKTAASGIREFQAGELGAKALRPSFSAREFIAEVDDMTEPEVRALGRAVRQYLDDAMSNVRRAVTDGDMTAREANKAIADLSSRAAREKVTKLIGKDKAGKLFGELAKVEKTLELRAGVAQNSRTFGRQATNRAIDELTEPNIAQKAVSGEPVKASRSILRRAAGMGPERTARRQDEINAALALGLTGQRGHGAQSLFNGLLQEQVRKPIPVSQGLLGPASAAGTADALYFGLLGGP